MQFVGGPFLAGAKGIFSKPCMRDIVTTSEQAKILGRDTSSYLSYYGPAMPRAKYRITKDDLNHACFYTNHRLSNHDFEFLVDADESDAEYYKAVDTRKTPTQRVALLNVWCEKYLPSHEWIKLKHGIRKRRQRAWDGSTEQTTITVSREVQKLLKRLAKRDNATYSECLEFYLRKALKASPPRRSIHKGR